jgi:hypothetical protein
MENIIQFETRRRSSKAYGEDYLTELRRIITAHVRPVTGAFLEWGAGHTTLALAGMREALAIASLDTIDDNEAYLATICGQMPAWPEFKAHYADLMGPKLSNRDPEPNYSTLPLSWGRTFDFIYIDGRRRVECAFIATLVSHPDTIVAMHDYRRGRYQPVKALYDIVEDGSQFRVMKPKAPAGDQAARAWRDTFGAPD